MNIKDLLIFIYNGGKISHEDWLDNEWISVKPEEWEIVKRTLGISR